MARISWHAAILVLGTALVAGSPNDHATLLERSAERVSIRTQGPFFLQASLTFTDGKRMVPGDLRLFWVNESKWRAEISLGDYHEATVGGEGKVWRERNVRDLPEAVWQLRELLSLDRTPVLSSRESVLRVRTDQSDADPRQCLEIGNTVGKTQREVCVDETSLVIVRERESQQGIQVERSYSNFKKAGARQFPAMWVSRFRGAELVSKVTRLTLNPALSEELFSPPDNVRPAPRCFVPEKKPELAQKSAPDFRSLNARRNVKVALFFYGTIERDGSVSVLKTFGNDDSWAQQSAVEALRRWRYEPARCQGKPVPLESFFEVQFDPY